MKKNRIFTVLLITIILLTQVGFVSTQGKTPPDHLTSDQMKNAVVVPDGTVEHRPYKEGQIYRFAKCDDTDPDSVCYFMVMEGDNATVGTNAYHPSSTAPLSSTNTLSCGVPVYNSLGGHLATLWENVNATFWGTFGQTPVTLNWGDLGGTYAIPFYTWGSLSGPNPSPNWGVYVARTGSGQASAGASGSLYLAMQGFPLQAHVTVRLIINRYGWYCQ